MKIQKIVIHNLRSIKHQEMYLEDYSLLIGENNAGKSNVIRALRIFYEEEKFNEAVDFPKFLTDDDDSWLEIEYKTTQSEQDGLKDNYKSADNILRIRKFLKSKNKDVVKANQSNIYAYENGKLSANLFYGAKNISQSKLGSIIFIPELSKIDDNMKLSGPSPLRNMINFVVKKIVEKSPSYTSLNKAFEGFNNNFKIEESDDGFSIKELTQSINAEMSSWNVELGFNINSVKADDLIKNLLSHNVKDGNLDWQTVSIDSFGQGLQRHLIYVLIRLSTNYENVKVSEKKEFAPDFNLILFEEPEAFLHPSQQETMNMGLLDLASRENHQILITTHSPIFVSKNIDKLSSLIKVKRDGETKLFQLSKAHIEELFSENNGLFEKCKKMLSDPSVPDLLKKTIRNKNLALENSGDEKEFEKEAFRYSLWVDGERAASFFSKHVIICEGASEKVFIDLLLKTEWTDLFKKHVYILDAMGKFNIHRYMNLFGRLGIKHSILLDKDSNANIHSIVNDFVEHSKNTYTNEIDWFDVDLEKFLGIPETKRKDLKPLNILYKYGKKEISELKIKQLKTKIETLIG